MFLLVTFPVLPGADVDYGEYFFPAAALVANAREHSVSLDLNFFVKGNGVGATEVDCRRLESISGVFN